MRCACSTSSPARPPSSPRPTWPPASSTACSTATISTSPARASTTARGASRPSGTPDFTAAYFDHAGLYAFGRQPEAIHWDLAQLAGCLALIAEAPSRWPTRSAAWPTGSRTALVAALLARLGVAPRGAGEDRALAAALIERAAVARRSAIDRFFFDWRGGRDPGRRDLCRRRRSARSPRALDGPRAAAAASLLVRPRALLDAYRGGRGDLGGDRRARRLGAVRGQDRRDPPHGRGDGRRRTRLDRFAPSMVGARCAWRTR